MNGRLPILAFHAVEDGPGPLCLSPSVLRSHVAILSDMGCRTVTIAEVAGHLSRGEPLPARTVVLSFDDGYRSVHDEALPILAGAGFTGTVFPVTGYLDGTTTAALPPPPGSPAVMTSAQLLELRSAGWEIGSHTDRHVPLAGLSTAELEDELDRADDALARLLGERPRVLAYPFGRHDAKAREVASARYDACVAIGASLVSAASDLAALDRIEAWYLRRPATVRHLYDGAGAAYLAVRRRGRAVAGRLRRRHG